MKLTKDQWDNIKVFVTVLVCIAIPFFLGYLAGFSNGKDWIMESIHERNCKEFYSDKPFSEVSADCYKYFNIKK